MRNNSPRRAARSSLRKAARPTVGGWPIVIGAGVIIAVIALAGRILDRFF